MNANRLVLVAMSAAVALANGAEAAQLSGPNAEVLATVRASIDAGLAGDMGKLKQQYAPDCTFIDEFAPFLWTGPNAFEGYFASGFHMYVETRHRPGKVRLGRPSFVYVSADKAFVVEPLSGTATVRGKPYASSGAFTYSLARMDGRWKITSQTWTKSRENLNPYGG